MNDTCATHRSRVPRRSFGRNKRRSDDIGRRERTRPGLYFMFCVWQSSVRGCRVSFVFVYFIKIVECSPVPASSFPYISTALHKVKSRPGPLSSSNVVTPPFIPSEAPPWDSRPVSGAGVVHYHSLHRPRSVPTALGPAPLVTPLFYDPRTLI